MIATRQFAWILLLVPACFHPSYDHPACGPNGECPGGWTCNTQQVCERIGAANDASVDAPPGLDDANNDAGSGLTCYGPTGWQVCFTSPPTGLFNLPGTINTDGGAPCAAIQPMRWGVPQPAACFVVNDTIIVPGGGTIMNGSKPLVLVAKSLITVAGVLDASIARGAVGATPTECQPFSQNPDPPSSGNGGGGGAGGSFRTKAGDGGGGDGGTQFGSANPADPMAPDHLRGGCTGQAGGAAMANDVGKVGFGGGSIYLLSGGEIALQKSINASGAGGSGGNNNAGGSGGGSGGMIVLFASTITVPPPPAAPPVLMANGGGGGGGSTGNKAMDGSDPSLTSPLTAANGGGNGFSSGGKGYPVLVTGDLNGAAGAAGGGGGGGGGGAAGYIRSNKPLAGATVSPPANIIP